MKSKLAKARDKWLQSEEGEKCSTGETHGQYLRNRIEKAFVAGADFSTKRTEELEDVLKEIAKSPQYRHVPNWVVIKCEQALKGSQ